MAHRDSGLRPVAELGEGVSRALALQVRVAQSGVCGTDNTKVSIWITITG